MTITDVKLRAYNQLLFGGRAISLDLHAGVINLIVAANGAGKTVLLDVLAKRVSFEEEIDVTWQGIHVARDVAYLPQQFLGLDDIFLQSFLNLVFPDRGESDPLLARYYRWAKAGRCLRDMSGGQRQLLMFLAVWYRPQMAHFYDEPLRHVDRLYREQVWRRLGDLAAEGKLVVLTNHEETCEETQLPSNIKVQAHVLD